MSQDVISGTEPPLDPDEAAIEATRAPLMAHLVELRDRLIWSLASIAVGFIICFFFAKPILQLLLIPYEEAVRAVKGVEALKTMGLIYTAPLENFLVQVNIAAFGGIFLAFPMIAFQAYRFIAPGLYSHEKKAFTPFLVVSPLLFMLGAAMAYFIVMPMLMQFSLRQEIIGDVGAASISYVGKIADYIGTFTVLILGFGFCFQLPVVLALLGRAGLVTSKQLFEGARYAILGVFIIAALVTPPDVISQIALGIPMVLLYYLGAWIVKLGEKKADKPLAP